MDKKLLKRVILASLASIVILILVPSLVFLLFEKAFNINPESFHVGTDMVVMVIVTFLVGLFFTMLYVYSQEKLPGKWKGVHLAFWFIVGLAFAKELSIWVFLKYNFLNFIARFIAYSISYLIMGFIVPAILTVKKNY